MDLKVYTSVVKGLTLKVRKFWGKVPTFAEVTGKKVVGRGLFARLPILNRVRDNVQRKTLQKNKKIHSENKQCRTLPGKNIFRLLIVMFLLRPLCFGYDAITQNLYKKILKVS